MGHTGSVLGTIWQTQWVPISRPCAVTTLVSGNAARDCHSFVGERVAPAREAWGKELASKIASSKECGQTFAQQKGWLRPRLVMKACSSDPRGYR